MRLWKLSKEKDDARPRDLRAMATSCTGWDAGGGVGCAPSTAGEELMTGCDCAS